MTRIMTNWDISFGVGGTVATIGLSQCNAILAFATGILTVTVMIMRCRREWQNRNKKPD